MKILVTGNMGYVGPGVVRQLRRAYPHAAIAGLDMGYFSHCLTNARELPECSLDVQYFGDVRTTPLRALADVDAVVYLAAISNDPMGQQFEQATLDVNYLAAFRLARAAKRAGARTFVLASSCSVYGFTESAPRTESSEVNPLTVYARSKVLAERALAEEADDSFRVTCLRFGTACGMSPRLRLDLVLNDLVAAAIASRRISVLSDGSPWRPLIHVLDMARAVEWAIGRQEDAGGNFLIINAGCDHWNFQVRELAETVAEVIRGVDVSINRGAQPDRRSYRVDFSLFRELAPHHQPQSDLKAVIAELRDGLESMSFRDADFRHSHLIRLKVLADLRLRGRLTPDLRWADGPEMNRNEEDVENPGLPAAASASVQGYAAGRLP
jgi:nucleoside-diphosphate-sugar epimerase